MDSSRTPLTAGSQFIQPGKFTFYSMFSETTHCFAVDDDDDLNDDLNDDDIPGFSHPTLATSTIPDKGKGRALPETEQLGPPSTSNVRPISAAVSGNIGQNTPRPANRQTIGGMQVETRCVLFVYEEERRVLRSRH